MSRLVQWLVILPRGSLVLGLRLVRRGIVCIRAISRLGGVYTEICCWYSTVLECQRRSPPSILRTFLSAAEPSIALLGYNPQQKETFSAIYLGVYCRSSSSPMSARAIMNQSHCVSLLARACKATQSPALDFEIICCRGIGPSPCTSYLNNIM